MSTYFVPQLDYRDDEENLSLVVIESVETEAWRFYANWAALRVESLQNQRVGVSSGDAVDFSSLYWRTWNRSPAPLSDGYPIAKEANTVKVDISYSDFPARFLELGGSVPATQQ
ncbi:hypothetical protein F442_03459 [Phytophthora nicotianae P10297]|uniref:Uncharacterized protein n=2 Tax=Phytophthora nicotianae TaxID=4792 RepID=W2ZVM8_PHYNI|nr:hypothetical protein F442_03459 [Phytophthora nicotianae P10297]